MFYRRGAWICAALFFLAACARQAPQPQAERIAILRLENLGQDTSADWIGRAIPVILEDELAGAPNSTLLGTAQLHALDRGLGTRPISAPGVSAERTQSLVAGANRIAYGYYSVRGGKLHVHLWIEDPQTQRIIKIADAVSAAGDAIGAATDLARQFTARPSPFITRNEASIRAYAQGLEAGDVAAASAHMEEAIAADPGFGPAYRSLAELEVQRQDRDAARAVLERGIARKDISPIERARMQLDISAIDNDPASRQQALAALIALEPRNLRMWQSFAETAMARHDYAAAADGFRRAVELDPGNVSLLNELGYAATYAGHFDEGVAALRKYRSLRPKDANALDSLGDLHLIANRYHEAEDFYHQAIQLDPNFNGDSDLFKSAMARLMTGDVAGADSLYMEYIAARTKTHDPGAPLLHSAWLWLTGRRKQASAELLAFAHTAESRNDRPLAARAYAGLAIWRLMSNDRASAQEMAQKAAPFADASTSTGIAIARFLAQPSASPEEWRTRAARFVPNAAQTNARNEMFAWALLLDGHFDAAKAPLRDLYDTTGTAANEGMPVLLAWCYVETGDFSSAAPLLALTPVPPATGIGTFTSLWFPRIFQLRAAVYGKLGKADEAKQNADLFAKLSPR